MDQSLQRELFDQCWPIINRMARSRYVPGGMEQDDLIQVAALKVWKNLPTFNSRLGVPVQAWCVQTVRWALIDIWRSTKVRSKDILYRKKVPEVLYRDPDPIMIFRISPRDEDILKMRAEGVSVQEIARHFGISKRYVWATIVKLRQVYFPKIPGRVQDQQLEK